MTGPFVLDPISIGLADHHAATAFDVIVVGSGYGGSIAASRLSRAGQRVCLLERGREILPGSYPTTLGTVRAELQVTTADAGRLAPGSLGMMELRLGEDMSVILGCGLGGGSLVNANVALPPDPRVFRNGWPDVYADGGALDEGMDRARKMLGVGPLPQSYVPPPPKLEALRKSAGAMGLEVELPDLAVTFEAGPNAAGIYQAACTRCGDCCSGCNYGAKNTLLMNYLPDAHKHGATLVTQAEVQTVLRDGTGWQVTVVDAAAPGSAPVVLTATTVVIAAGALGSTELLFRSAKAGLPLATGALGTRFSGNGDILGFGFGANTTLDSTVAEPPPVYSFGAGGNAPDAPRYQPGPCITGVIKVNWKGAELSRALIVEDGVGPGALAEVYPALFFAGEALAGGLTDFPDTSNRLKDYQALGTAVQSGSEMWALTYQGLMARTQSYLVMSHDEASGRLRFDETLELVSVDWPGVGSEAPYPGDNEVLRQASEAIWANYLANPLWSTAFGEKLVTVHPIGGCPMAGSAAEGVVDADCRVFTGTGEAVYDDLLVCDGSVIPTSLGVNPFLTISAVAERAMTRLIAAKRWSEDQAPAPLSPTPLAPSPAEAAPPFSARLRRYLGEASTGFLALAVAYGVAPKTVDLALEFIFDLLSFLVPDPAKAQRLRQEIKAAFHAANPGDMAAGCTEMAQICKRLAQSLSGDDPYGALIAEIRALAGDAPPSVGFSEAMTGWVAPAGPTFAHPISDPYAIAEAKGRGLGLAMTGDFTVFAASSDRLAPGGTASGGGSAALGGTVTLAKGGKTTNYALSNGRFTLLKEDEAAIERWVMGYAGDLGTDYRLEGHKTLERRQGSDWWPDLTTLYVDLLPLEGGGPGPLCGIIRLGLQALARQAGTISSGWGTGPDPLALAGDILADIREGRFAGAVTDRSVLHRAVLIGLDHASTLDEPGVKAALNVLVAYYDSAVASLFGRLVFRTYGGLPAYLSDFPAQDAAAKGGFSIPCAGNGYAIGPAYPEGELHPLTAADGAALALYRFNGGRNGPVILSPGFAMTALSYGMLTNGGDSFLTALLDAGYDVWLFDNRSSPLAPVKATRPFTLDDMVDYDWPAAVAQVLRETGAPSVQIVAHCMGSMTAQMAVLAGKIGNIRQMISSQLTVHPVPNWFNQLKADTNAASTIANGVPPALLKLLAGADPALLRLLGKHPTVDAVSRLLDPGDHGYTDNALMNLLAWRAPFGEDHVCYSPSCHRIYGIYGPILWHDNLNEATHAGLREVFGEISTKPFEQIGLIMERGHAVRADGSNAYLPGYRNFDFPVHVVSGALNQEFLPDTTLRTQRWLQDMMPKRKGIFTRTLVPGFAHLDFFIGKDAAAKVFPDLVAKLDEGNRTAGRPGGR